MDRGRRRRQVPLCRPLDQYFDFIVGDCAMCSEICNYRQGSLADCASKCPKVFQKMASTALMSAGTLAYPTLSTTTADTVPLKQLPSYYRPPEETAAAAGLGMTMWILIVSLVFISLLVIVVLIIVVVVARRKIKNNLVNRDQVGGNAVHQENVTIPLMEHRTQNNNDPSSTTRENQTVFITSGKTHPPYVRSQSAGATESVSVKPNNRQFQRSHSTGGTRTTEVQTMESQSTRNENQTMSTSVESAWVSPSPFPPAEEDDQNCSEFRSSLYTPADMNNKRAQR